MVNRQEIEAWYRDFQDRFCQALETFDGGRFQSETWKRPGGGGGDTRILTGDRIEKAACNVSAVWGESPPSLQARTGAGSDFFATGVSIIVHPANPYAPTFHANVRYFETGDDAWFGGGADLTPWYLFDEDARHFHMTLKASCDRHEIADHPAWKQTCDEYFYLKHRGETRGVGGLFFDHLRDRIGDVWDFQRDLADQLVPAYLPILERRADLPFGPDQRRWQEIRRGRYVEFNLIWDRGTRFGLESGGRTESILASLPPLARWEHDAEPDPGSPEAALLALLRGEPREWA